jgi:hypothetical protein
VATVETIKREWSDGGGIRAALAYIVTRLAIRKEEALKIDPETADFDWSYAQTLDPYGVRDEWEMRKMQDIKLTIPVGLTAARIKSLALVSEQAAYEMAVELHSIVADYRRLLHYARLVASMANSRRPMSSRRSCGPLWTYGPSTNTCAVGKAYGCMRGSRK